jgi:hypothetical protein
MRFDLPVGIDLVFSLTAFTAYRLYLGCLFALHRQHRPIISQPRGNRQNADDTNLSAIA